MFTKKKDRMQYKSDRHFEVTVSNMFKGGIYGAFI